MVFEQVQNVPPKEEKGFKAWYKKFSSQPHQPFFSSGILFFILFLSLFIGVFSNSFTIDASLLTYHAYSMVFVVFIQFFLGFLFVVFPRFLMQAEIKPKVYMNQFLLYFFSSLAIFISLIVAPSFTVVFQVVLFVAQVLSFKLLYDIHQKSIVNVKDDTKWVLISFACGLVAHLLFIVSSFDLSYSYYLDKISINSGFYLFLFMIIFTISQRMIPFFSKAKVPEYVVNKTHNLTMYVFVLILLKVIVLSFDNVKLNLISDIPLFILITRELIKWKLPLFKTPAIMWVLYLGLYWIPVGLFLSITESVMAFVNPEIIFSKAVLHTFALGYFVTVLLGFGTRVVLGHSGATPTAGKFAIAIFIGAQIITLFRLVASFSLNFQTGYIFFINLTAILLVLALIIWSAKYVTILLKGK